jgi:23S rRNA pseudouridine1911/1915/1917 synthase
VHLAAAGHPLVGDPAYGGRRRAKGTNGALPAFGRQALHATRLSLSHPATHRRMAWDADPPDDLSQLIKALRAQHESRSR